MVRNPAGAKTLHPAHLPMMLFESPYSGDVALTAFRYHVSNSLSRFGENPKSDQVLVILEEFWTCFSLIENNLDALRAILSYTT